MLLYLQVERNREKSTKLFYSTRVAMNDVPVYREPHFPPRLILLSECNCIFTLWGLSFLENTFLQLHTTLYVDH
jgi:hypothetical protein